MQSRKRNIVYYFDDLVSYCISIEASNTSSAVSYHVHAFLEFESKLFISDLRQWVEVVLNASDEKIHFDLQPCRSRKSCLKYISKEDRDLYTDIKELDFSFYYRSYK